MGRTKAAVLPLPVDARAKICDEVFEMRYGITAFWTGEGCLYPRDLQVFKSGGANFRSSNVEMFVGTAASFCAFCIWGGAGSIDRTEVSVAKADDDFTLDLFFLNSVDIVLLR